MTADERLAQVASALACVGLRYLVMGGHAVRHYGIGRDAFDFDFDFDFHLSLAGAQNLTEQIPELFAAPLRKVVPGSARHLALVEALRRVCRQNAVAADRADKQRFR